MHLPDGFLDPKTWATLDVASVGIVGYAVKKTTEKLDEEKIPLMGVMAAFIFAAQMLNFPVLGGTSGHLIGGVMAAVFLGPWAATLVMTAIFIVQCLFFQDGGLLAMGANIFNMGIIGTILGYYIYQAIRKFIDGDKGILAGAFVASWIAVVLAALATSLELAISGTSPLRVVLPAMVGVHMVIGLGEAFITTTVVGFVLKVRRDLIPGAERKSIEISQKDVVTE